MKRSFLLLILNTSQALPIRDPFVPASGSHMYTCNALGKIHVHPFALLSIDGICYLVNNKDKIAGHDVIAITDSHIQIKDESGREHKIMFKKKPFNFKQAEGLGG